MVAILRSADPKTTAPAQKDIGFLISERPAWSLLRRSAPFLLFALLVVTSTVWNEFVGISWQAPTNAEIGIIAAALGAISLYSAARKAKGLSEASLFLLVYALYPLYGIRLSYLAITLHFPLVDEQMSHIDPSLGFHWLGLVRFMANHPRLLPIEAFFYQSHLPQTVVLCVYFSFLRPSTRNYEMLFLLLLGLILTLLVLAFFPTLGPGSVAHVPVLQERIITMLREGHIQNLPYEGIISFPSYHTIMAIVFVYCTRGTRLVFPAVLLWNLVMLLTVPNGGDHYLSDMIAGSVIAIAAIGVSRLIYPAHGSAAMIGYADYKVRERALVSW